MNSKEKSKEKTENQKDSSSEENEKKDPLFRSTAHQMLLDLEEKPEIIIEKILINLFNKYINPDHVYNEYLEIQMQQNKIKLLCSKQEKSKIVYILLFKIRSLIKKYKEKLFELPNIIELREKIFQKFNKRSRSFNKIITNNYLNFCIEKRYVSHSYPKIKQFKYYLVVKNLICELKNIRNCLKITAPLIEKIFEEPLSKYDKFSIWECEKEDYLKILIHDSFIWNQISKSKNSYLSDIIEEITEDDNNNLIAMTYRLNYFKHIEEYKKNNLDDILKILEAGSSIDTRFPEDAQPIHTLSELELFKSLLVDKDIKYSYEEADIDDYTNSDEQNIENKTLIKKIETHKITNLNIHTKSGENKNSVTSKQIKNITININKEQQFFDLPSILKNNEINTREDFEKLTSLNRNNINKKKKKDIKKKNLNKKENNNKKPIKIDKNEIPNDIDALVKYIVNDDKTETQNKKKKKNKKRKKKNKNEIKEDKKEEKEDDIIEKEMNDEIEDIKKDLLKNSINRYKIHKIKFKYRPKWLNKISKNS